MKGGRLRVVNTSRYPDDEVTRLVRFGMSEIDLTGEAVLVVVKNAKVTRRRKVDYSGTFFDWKPPEFRKLMRRHERFLIVVRIGAPECFPIRPFTRNGVYHDYKTWQEALVAISAHEGLHAQHAYDDDYTERTRVTRKVPYMNSTRVEYRRLGTQRIEPKCERHERRMIEQWREVAA